MVPACCIHRIDLINFALSQRRRAPTAAPELTVRLTVQFPVGKCCERLSFGTVAGFCRMIVFSALWIVVHCGIIFRIWNLSSLPVFPDDNLHIGFSVFPDPFHVDAAGGSPSLDADAAVAGLLSQFRFIGGIPGRGRMRHLMNQVPRIIPDGIGTDHVAVLESADRR